MTKLIKINLSEETKKTIYNRRNTTHVTESEKHYKNYYNRDLANRVYKLYEIDFIKFGYKKETFDE